MFSIKMIAVNVMKSSLIPKEIYKFVHMNHVNTNMDFISFDYFNITLFLISLAWHTQLERYV